MERHNVLILSNLDTEEHLEIGISLISDALLRRGGKEKKRGMCISLARCVLRSYASLEGFQIKNDIECI